MSTLPEKDLIIINDDRKKLIKHIPSVQNQYSIIIAYWENMTEILKCVHL